LRLEQWFFRIRTYADELLDFSHMDWPERVMTMQRNWIGRSEGLEIDFGLDVPGVEEKTIRVFTTRPDTIFGVTSMVLAPEHPLVPRITTPDRKAEVEAYIDQARKQTEIERLSTEREKTGVFTGAYCKNLLSGEDVPIWIADYALLVRHGRRDGRACATPAGSSSREDGPGSRSSSPADWGESRWTRRTWSRGRWSTPPVHGLPARKARRPSRITSKAGLKTDDHVPSPTG
jgi:hypothetical protein